MKTVETVAFGNWKIKELRMQTSWIFKEINNKK